VGEVSPSRAMIPGRRSFSEYEPLPSTLPAAPHPLGHHLHQAQAIAPFQAGRANRFSRSGDGLTGHQPVDGRPRWVGVVLSSSMFVESSRTSPLIPHRRKLRHQALDTLAVGASCRRTTGAKQPGSGCRRQGSGSVDPSHSMLLRPDRAPFRNWGMGLHRMAKEEPAVVA